MGIEIEILKKKIEKRVAQIEAWMSKDSANKKDKKVCSFILEDLSDIIDIYIPEAIQEAIDKAKASAPDFTYTDEDYSLQTCDPVILGCKFRATSIFGGCGVVSLDNKDINKCQAEILNEINNAFEM